MPRARAAGRIFFVGSFVAFGLVILMSSQPPLLRDYPDWVFQGVLLAKVLTGHPVAAYAMKAYPVPNSLTTVGLGLLTLGFGWVMAAKVWLVLSLAFAGWTSWTFAGVLGARDNGLWWVLPATLFGCQTFWYATVSFSIGMGVLLLLGCVLYRREERAGVVAGLLLLCFFTHLIVYAAALVMIALYGAQAGRWRLGYVALATTPLVGWYFIGRTLSHSRESDLGHSPLSHLAVTALVGGALLAAGRVRRCWSVVRLATPVLTIVPAVLVLGAALSGLLRLSGTWAASPVNLLRFKAMSPFELFGFVSIVYKPVNEVVLSSTLTLLQRPWFLLLMGLDLALGGGLMVAALRALLVLCRQTMEEDHARFLWEFAAFFGVVYLVCPPNALGVIRLDMRVAQLAFAPVLFLLARAEARVLRWAAVPMVVLVAASLYGFAQSQKRVVIAGTPPGLVPVFSHFCAVDPIIIAEEYDRLRAGRLEGHIFATGMFVPAGDDR